MRLCEYDAADLAVLLPSLPKPTAAPVPPVVTPDPLNSLSWRDVHIWLWAPVALVTWLRDRLGGS